MTERRGEGQAHLRKPLSEGLASVGAMLGVNAKRVLEDPGRMVSSFVIERFMSPTFIETGRGFMAGLGGVPEYDRSLAIVRFADGGITFVEQGRTSTGPFELFHVTLGGTDFRPLRTTIYEFDGRETMVVTEQGKPPVTYQVSEGQKSGFHQNFRDNAGRHFRTERYG